MQYSITLCSSPEVASDVASGKFMRQIVIAKTAEFGYPWFLSYWTYRVLVVGDIFARCRSNFRPEVVEDYITGISRDASVENLPILR